jgi:hypothetical protein
VHIIFWLWISFVVPISCTCMPIVGLHRKVDGRIGEVGARAVAHGALHFSVDCLALTHFGRAGREEGTSSPPRPIRDPFRFGGWGGVKGFHHPDAARISHHLVPMVSRSWLDVVGWPGWQPSDSAKCSYGWPTGWLGGRLS